MSGVFDVLARLPHAELGHTLTPIDPLPRLGSALGLTRWIKRDYMTGLSMGENKARQLADYFCEGLDHDTDRALSSGR